VLPFRDQVNEFLLSQGKETRTAAVIQSNPDQSKHLETARMRVNDIWIDLVNLRSESYAEGSRIPSAIEFGTPLEDATRRWGSGPGGRSYILHAVLRSGASGNCAAALLQHPWHLTSYIRTCTPYPCAETSRSMHSSIT
jgi:Poly A polymerase head domain